MPGNISNKDSAFLLERTQFFCNSEVPALLCIIYPDIKIISLIKINIDNMSAFDDGTLDQCQELNVSPMAWCPLGGVVYPAWGHKLTEEQTGRIQTELALQAEKYETEPWIVILAWLLRHPAGILPIVGSTRPSRIRAATKSLDLEYTPEDWYRLLQARNGYEVP